MESRRQFLGALAALPAAIGALREARASVPPPLPAQADDAVVFERLRQDLHIPREVTYCNTGTLGAVPREVMSAMVNGLRATETALPDWPYFQADGEPLTGYQPLLAARTFRFD